MGRPRSCRAGVCAHGARSGLCGPTLTPGAHSVSITHARGPQIPGFCQFLALNLVRREWLLHQGLWLALFTCLCQSGSSHGTDALREEKSSQVIGVRSPGQEVTQPGQDPALAGSESYTITGPRLSSADEGSRVPKLQSPGQAGVAGSTGFNLHQVSRAALSTLPLSSQGSGRRSVGDVTRSVQQGAAHPGGFPHKTPTGSPSFTLNCLRVSRR